MADVNLIIVERVSGSLMRFAEHEQGMRGC